MSEARSSFEEGEGACRRAYYRVTGTLPIRVSPLANEDLDKVLFEMTMPAPSMLSGLAHEVGEETPLSEALRRIEEKLDLLLARTVTDGPGPLGVEDCEVIVFSGSGLSLPVDEPFEKHDLFRVEILLPPPYARLVRGVGRAVSDVAVASEGVARFQLAMALEHLTDDDRDALVGYSYDLQRVALRSRDGQEARG